MTVHLSSLQRRLPGVHEAITLFSQSLKSSSNRDLSSTSKKVASLIKIALVNAFTRNESNFACLSSFYLHSVDLDSISGRISRLKDSQNPNIDLLLNLTQIFDLYTGLEHMRSREDLSLLASNNASLSIPNHTFMRVESLTSSEDRLVANFFNSPSENIHWRAPAVLAILKKVIASTDRGDFSYLLKFYGHLNTYEISTRLEKNPNSAEAESLEEIIKIAETCKSLFALYEDIHSRIFFPSSISRPNDHLITLGNIETRSVVLRNNPTPFAKIVPFSSINQEAIQTFSETVEKGEPFDTAFKTAAKRVLRLLHAAFSYASYGDFSFLLRFQSHLFDLEKLNKILKKTPPDNEELMDDLGSISFLYELCLLFVCMSQEATLRVLFPKNPHSRSSELIELGSHFDKDAAKSKFS